MLILITKNSNLNMLVGEFNTMYTSINFQSKKAFKQAVADGVEVILYQPGPFGNGPMVSSGRCAVEGPHFPQPHKWYATATVENGVVTKVQ